MSSALDTHPWVAYVAAGWSLAFAVLSFYWAAGGTATISTQARTIQDLAREREPWFVALLWLTALLKLVAGLLPLLLLRGVTNVVPAARLLPRRLLLVATWGAGILMAGWGGLNFLAGLVVGVLRLLGLVEPLPPSERSLYFWHLLLWDPVWLIAGALLVVTAWLAGRRA